MGAKEKWLAQRKRTLKRRARRPTPSVIVPTRTKANRGLMPRMSANHPDVLQNIEFEIVQAYRESDEVDDAAVATALEAAMHDQPSDDPIVARLLRHLVSVREIRQDLAESIWQDGLRVVRASVSNHSKCRPGEVDYLRFVSQFVR